MTIVNIPKELSFDRRGRAVRVIRGVGRLEDGPGRTIDMVAVLGQWLSEMIW